MGRGKISSLKSDLTLTDDECEELKYWVRNRNIKACLARRARIVLLFANGNNLSETARKVGITRKMTRHWIIRFIKNRIAGLEDKKGRGRKSVKKEFD